MAGFVNYFGTLNITLIDRKGKAPDVDSIEINPILLRKGNTHLALYGLGNVRDERLHRFIQANNIKFRTFEENKVKFMRPPNKKDYFNLFVIHQNRFIIKLIPLL